MAVTKFVLNETSYFGEGARSVLADEIKNRGFKKVLVVTDKSLYEVGVSKKVTDILDEAGIEYGVYHDVLPNPPIANVNAGIQMCKEIGADLIVAVGGGSSIDTAKAISIIMTNPDRSDVVSLNGASNTKNKGLPIIAIVDTELMASMPKSIAASTGMDALTHAIEGYITKNRNTMSQMFSMKAIQLIYDNLDKAVNERDQEAINNMGLGQYIAGMAFSNVGLGIVHSMAHQLGAVYDTPHGLANAILLPTVMKFNGETSYEEYREILTQAFHTDATRFTKEEVIKTFCEKIKDLSEKVGITQTVGDVGGKREDIPMLADKAMEDPCKPGNPRDVTREDFIKLYEEAM